MWDEEGEKVKGPIKVATLLPFSEGDYVLAIPKGTFHHPLAGTISFEEKNLKRMEENFKRGVLGRKPVVNIEHIQIDPQGAAGWVEDVEAREDGLYLKIEWTDRGKELLSRNRFKYLSPEVWMRYKDFEGMGHTNRAAVSWDEVGTLLLGGRK